MSPKKVSVRVYPYSPSSIKAGTQCSQSSNGCGGSGHSGGK